MAKLLQLDGKISEIKLNGEQSILRAVGGDYSHHILLSGDAIVFNDAQWPGALPINDLATSVSGRKMYGPCLLCDPKEID